MGNYTQSYHTRRSGWRCRPDYLKSLIAHLELNSESYFVLVKLI